MEAAARAAPAGNFAAGERLEVWSNSQGRWVPDGVVVEAPVEDCVAEGYTIPARALKVTSSAGAKWIMPEYVTASVRRISTTPQDVLRQLDE